MLLFCHTHVGGWQTILIIFLFDFFSFWVSAVLVRRWCLALAAYVLVAWNICQSHPGLCQKGFWVTVEEIKQCLRFASVSFAETAFGTVPMCYFFGFGGSWLLNPNGSVPWMVYKVYVDIPLIRKCLLFVSFPPKTHKAEPKLRWNPFESQSHPHAAQLWYSNCLSALSELAETDLAIPAIYTACTVL